MTDSPCYKGLKNNVPTPLLEMSINNWRPDTQDYVNHSILKDYIQDTAAAYDINSLTWFNTRVEHVENDAGYWHVQTSTLSKTASGKLTKILKTWVCPCCSIVGMFLTIAEIRLPGSCYRPLSC